MSCPYILHIFFFNDTATTEIYTLSLHDALPIYHLLRAVHGLHHLFMAIEIAEQELLELQRLLPHGIAEAHQGASLCAHLIDRTGPCLCNALLRGGNADRKSTRLNSSHSQISYAVFC